jgi:hypothetical protein
MWRLLNPVHECRRTEDGNAYPIHIPWGNTGTTISGVCLAALYMRYGIDKDEDQAMKDARCFMHRQLGFLTNHKCSRRDHACSTTGPSGYSYIVG